MQITKYRTVAMIYPHLSLECEVVDENGKKYYPNISVNDKGNPEELLEDNHWCYTKPMDRIGLDEEGKEIDYDSDYNNSICEIEDSILTEMLNFWNANPIFTNDVTWKSWPTDKKEDSATKYLIYGKYRKESNHKFLAKVVDSKEEALKKMEEYQRHMYPEMVPITTLFKDCETMEDKICAILREIPANEESLEMQNKRFSVEIRGDWKHEHLHTDCILQETFGATLYSEEITEDDGSDFYTAIHTYLLP